MFDFAMIFLLLACLGLVGLLLKWCAAQVESEE